MSIFSEINLDWAGKAYAIPPNRVLGAIAVVEDVVTLHEIIRTQAERGTVKGATVARAYGALLRYAGAKVDDDEVYLGLFSAGGVQANVAEEAVTVLLAMMTPPAPPGGGAKPAGKSKAAARSSRRRTR